MKLSEEIINSFKDNKEGLGAKRLTAFNIMALITLWHIFIAFLTFWALLKLQTENFLTLLYYAFYTFIVDTVILLLLLAIITVPQIIELINTFRGNKPKQQDNEQTPTA